MDSILTTLMQRLRILEALPGVAEAQAQAAKRAEVERAEQIKALEVERAELGKSQAKLTKAEAAAEAARCAAHTAWLAAEQRYLDAFNAALGDDTSRDARIRELEQKLQASAPPCIGAFVSRLDLAFDGAWLNRMRPAIVPVGQKREVAEAQMKAWRASVQAARKEVEAMALSCASEAEAGPALSAIAERPELRVFFTSESDTFLAER